VDSNLALALFAAAPVPETWRSLLLAGPLDIKIKPDLSWLEQNSHILYPLFAIGTIALLVMGIFMAWKSDEVSGVLKVEYKREIITILRREPGGVNVARLAKELKLTVHKTAKIVEEMVNDRQVLAQAHKGVTHVRLRF
jgi:hypothetical protein